MRSTAIVLLLSSLFLFACTEEQAPDQSQSESQTQSAELEAIFPQGQLGSADLFTGAAYNYGLLPMDSIYTTLIGNVYFEPGARSNWHTHPAGQILIITDGVGYHQIEGQPKEIIKKGDVVKCPPNTRHWHGASADAGLQQMYILPNTEKGIVEWMEAVSDEVYTSGD